MMTRMVASAIHIFERLEPSTGVEYRQRCDAVGAAHADVDEPASRIDRDLRRRVANVRTATHRRNTVDHREVSIDGLRKHEHSDRDLADNIDPPARVSDKVTRFAAPGKHHLMVRHKTDTRLVTPHPEKVETEVGGGYTSVRKELRRVRARAPLIPFMRVGRGGGREAIGDNSGRVELVEQYLPISPTGNNEVSATRVDCNVTGRPSGGPHFAHRLEMF